MLATKRFQREASGPLSPSLSMGGGSPIDLGERLGPGCKRGNIGAAHSRSADRSSVEPYGSLVVHGMACQALHMSPLWCLAGFLDCDSAGGPP